MRPCCTSSVRQVVPRRWNRNPRPQPQSVSKLVFLRYFSSSYLCLSWLSGALVGVGGSDFSNDNNATTTTNTNTNSNNDTTTATTTTTTTPTTNYYY